MPGDCSVIGFDDVPLAAVSTPALTTIRQPMEQMGSLAAEWVLESLKRNMQGSRLLCRRALCISYRRSWYFANRRSGEVDKLGGCGRSRSFCLTVGAEGRNSIIFKRLNINMPMSPTGRNVCPLSAVQQRKEPMRKRESSCVEAVPR